MINNNNSDNNNNDVSEQEKNDLRYAMSLQLQEGLHDEDQAIIISPALAVASNNNSTNVAFVETTDHHTDFPNSLNDSSNNNDDDDDHRLAWALQEKENEAAFLRAQQHAISATPLSAVSRTLSDQDNHNNFQAPFYRQGNRATYASAAASAPRDDSDDEDYVKLPAVFPGKVAVVPSNDDNGGGKVPADTEPESQHRNHQSLCWYDVTREGEGDPVFIQLLGKYTDTSPLGIEIANTKEISTNPTVLSEAAMSASILDNPSRQLQQFCESMFGSKPVYIVSEDGPPQDRRFVTTVVLHSEDNIVGTGQGKTKNVSIARASRQALESLSFKEAATVKDYAARAQNLSISFRGAAAELPFCLRFQLERSLLSDTELIQVRIKKRTRGRKEEQERQKLVVAIEAKKMLLVFTQAVLPPLLLITEKIRGDNIGDCVALFELFTNEIWGPLRKVKEAIKKGNTVDFFEDHVHQALDQAKISLQLAEKLCRAIESELDGQGETMEYIELIQKRSLWPIAEYRCKFLLDGTLLPTSYSVLNKDILTSTVGKPPSIHQAMRQSPANTRRALREVGWAVRDRFVLISSIKFHDVYRKELVGWLKAKPNLCNRQYDYLFDKGTGKPSIWLYSPTTTLSRSAFFTALGFFDDVHPTKLGDRVSLAFTNTKPVAELSMEQIVAIPEIVGNGYTFSDGCGVMGINIAKKVMGVESTEDIPGSCQIRLAGIKGMLSLKVDFPPDKIGIRPSMCKFPSNHKILEVKRVAKANVSRDNKLFSQILLIMHHLRVPNRVFLDLQARAFAEMASEYDIDALELLEDPVDIAEVSKYVRNVVKHGRKGSRVAFSTDEFRVLTKYMTQAKAKINLRCSITLMLGVVDEHGLLEEGELLVGNGMVQGPVLICRSPCNAPGDIQKATAIAGVDKAPYAYLKDTLVFSAKGQRPLPDKLGGGDLDGDEYYVIDESRLVEELTAVEASDFGSQKEHIEKEVSIQKYFSASKGLSAPNLTEQLDVFQRYMSLGDIVAKTSDAWVRVADKEGPNSSPALKMALMCQRALDARKLAFALEPKESGNITKILADVEVPHWMGGSPWSVGSSLSRERKSRSILGILYDKWASWISDLESSKNRYNRPYIETSKARNDPDFKNNDAETVASQDTEQVDAPSAASMERECIVCRAKAYKKCYLCEVVWLCSDECKRTHWTEAAHGPVSTKSAMEILIDVTFGRSEPLYDETRPIDYRSLSRADLQVLANMVLLEYRASLHGGINEAGETSKDSPHAFDVFLVSKGLLCNESLSVCRTIQGSDGELEWLVKDGILPFDEVKYHCRVASLSGPARILESLISEPGVGSLMYHAMKRTKIFEVAEADVVSLDPAIVESLNESQRRVVATVVNPSFRTGFVAVQGPPGTGKTSTIVGIVSAVERGVLVTAPSNAAVANLALKLISTSRFGSWNVVVWGENCDESVRFLNSIHRSNRYQGFLRSYTTTQDEVEKESKLREFASWLHLDSSDAVSLKEIAALCGSTRNDSGGHKLCDSTSVVLCTLNTAGSIALRKAAQNKFDLLILDEASQCPEVEFYIATTFPGVRRIVVVGDPKQLPATVLHQGCQEAGYGNSFLGHILEFQPEKVHLLDTQYRMDPLLLEFVNQAFYNNKVVSAECVFDRQPKLENPFQFVSTSEDGYGSEERQGFSWFNEYEAVVIKSILCNDEDIIRLQEATGNTARIIVISPYKAQVMRLRRELKKIKSLRVWDVSTVDNFQGQEGDIVILSTVRTNSVGFVDDENRLCVALSRARRVLRVVGDIDFFKSITAEDSILKKLAAFAQSKQLVEVANIKSADWRRPDWKTVTKWKPTMTSRFHNCLKEMRRRDRNVAFNTLLAVATPELKELKERPTEIGPPRWQMSALVNGGSDVLILWLAREYERSVGLQYVGAIEAHFAGTRSDCLTFTQKHHLLPEFARAVKRDLSAIVPRHTNDNITTRSTEVDFHRWLVTNEVQDAVINDAIEVLPEGLFALDEQQDRIISLKPPLLLESRSGTGKTNVLFQHAVSYARGLVGETPHAFRPICFVTVSPKLRQELQRRYNEVKEISQIELPPILFLSFRDFLGELLRLNRITNMTVSSACTYLEYVHSKRSHEKLSIESSLVENEIGGVIEGSLSAALKKKPLDEEQYLEEKRSNIPINTEEGRDKRKLVYQDYSRYAQWKIENNKYDLGDIVLELCKLLDLRMINDIFQSAYLDEVQDFSYASIFLICSIAGKSEAQWVAAGDTAQMISPGCSFTFAGLTQTLRSIRKDVVLRKVEQLRRNYRMTKGVLEVGNAILQALKTHFPGAIESPQPEIAMKDLGLKVALISWEDAFTQKASFGVQQAIVYSSSDDSSALGAKISDWLGNHPFVLSSLDSKGLEFDDVVVAFDMKRKAWDLKSMSVDSLRLLRELYVAVTRARRRVVILYKQRDKAMRIFFESLKCDLEMSEASVIMLEFDKATTNKEWFDEGSKHFNDEKYPLAASCFNAANNYAWSGWAQGREFAVSRISANAKLSFRTAAGLFFESSDYKRCLDLMTEIAEIKPWDDEDNGILDMALEKEPYYLPRLQTVKFALYRNAWHAISLDDLKDRLVSNEFLAKRGDVKLIEMIRNCTEQDRVSIKLTLPALMGDFYLECHNFPEAIILFLNGKDEKMAVQATDIALEEAKAGRGDLLRVVECWRSHGEERKTLSNSKVALLLSLFESPREAAAKQAAKCMLLLGRQVIKLAVTRSGSKMEELHYFDHKAFQQEVREALASRYATQPINVVQWYHEHKDKEHAVAFAAENLQNWSDEELVSIIIGKFALRPGFLVEELERRMVLVKAARICLQAESWDIEFAEEVSNKTLESIQLAEQNMDELLHIWRAKRNDRRVSELLSLTINSSKIALFLRLFEKPEETGGRYGKKCMTSFGKNIVKKAVLAGGPYKRDNFSVLCLFDKKEFESERPKQRAKQQTDKDEAKPGSPSPFQVGHRVVVSGLKNQTALNGRHGKITAQTKKDGRFGVLFDGDTEAKSIHPNNLTKEEDAKPGSPSPFQVGHRVVVSGLKNQTALNGRHGKITAQRKKNRRFDVLFDGDTEVKSIHPNNLTKEDEDISESSGHDSIPSLTKGRDSSSDGDSSVPDVNKRRAPGAVDSSEDSSDADDSLPDLIDRATNTAFDADDSDDSSAEVPDLMPRKFDNSSDESDDSSDISDLPAKKKSQQSASKQTKAGGASGLDGLDGLRGVFTRTADKENGDASSVDQLFDSSSSDDDVPDLLPRSFSKNNFSNDDSRNTSSNIPDVVPREAVTFESSDNDSMPSLTKGRDSSSDGDSSVPDVMHQAPGAADSSEDSNGTDDSLPDLIDRVNNNASAANDSDDSSDSLPGLVPRGKVRSSNDSSSDTSTNPNQYRGLEKDDLSGSDEGQNQESRQPSANAKKKRRKKPRIKRRK